MSRSLHSARHHGQRLLPHKFALALTAAFTQGAAALSGIAGVAGLAGVTIAAALPATAHADAAAKSTTGDNSRASSARNGTFSGLSLAVTPAFLNAGSTTLNLQSATTGTAYLALLEGANATCGTPSQTQAGQDSQGNPAYRIGSSPLTADTPASYTFSNLLASSAYTACVINSDGSTLQDTVAHTVLTTRAQVAHPNPTWTEVGTTGFSAGEATSTQLVFAPDGTPYVAFQDGGNGYKATVMKYSNGAWSVVGTAGFSSGRISNPSLAFSPDGTPYLAYRNNGGAAVMKFTNGAWNLVGNANFSAGTASYCSLAFGPDGTPYLGYQDSASAFKATVMKFNGSSWVTVGNPGLSAGQAYDTSLVIGADGTPYIAYRDNTGSNANYGKATVMKFTNGSWSTVGSQFFTAGRSFGNQLAMAQDGTLHLTYWDGDQDTKAVVMKFANGTWSTVGGASVTPDYVDAPSLAFAPDGTPSLAFVDGSNNGQATLMHFSNNSWSVVSTAGFTPDWVDYTSLAFGPDGTAFIAYQDESKNKKASVMKLVPGIVVTATPGDRTASLSFATPADNGSALTAYVLTLTPANGTPVTLTLAGIGATTTSTVDGITATITSVSGGNTVISITGLTNGTAYTAGITASSAIGNAAASTRPLVSVTPQVVPPGAPTIGTATAGDGRLSVSFTAPASSGSSAITGYTATCSDGTHSFTGTGSSSPIAVSGLTNGTAYTCTVTATSSIGTSPASAATASATPAASATPVTPTNPFNPGGTSTSTEVNNNVGNNLGGGVTVTPATGSIISNLSEVNHTTGVSDNGVVVVNAPPGTTIKLVDNAPNGVLFSLPVQQAIPVQLQGKTVAITVNNEVVRGSDGKPLTAVLATRTVPTPSGGSQQVLEVVSGQGQFQASSANQLLGALTLSQGGTLRTVTIVDNSGNGGGTTIPGTAGFFKDPKDKSGSVSAENGAVVLNVVLTPEGATAGNRLAAETIIKQITLQAGEVARFNAKGELIGVFAGSLSGTLGKTGDPVAVTAPAGLSAYPAKAVKLDGNILDRLGSNLLPAFAAAIDGTSNFADDGSVTATSASTLTQDAATGIVTATYQARSDTQFPGLPVGNVTVDPATPDGIVWHTNGSVTWSRKGVSVTFVPVSPALTDLAASAKQAGYATQVLDNGVLKLTGNASYLVGLPRFAAIKEGKAAGFAWEAAEQRATFTDAQGYTQIIDPVPYDGSQLDGTVAGMSGWKMSREYFLYGTLRLSGPGGEQFLLTPDYAVTLGKDSALGGSAYTGDDGRLHYGFTTGFLPFSQGFAVK